MANIISICRIVLSILLLFCYNNDALFIPVYLTCGLSDVLDGYVARKTKTQSSAGAKLDSIGDMAMFTSIVAVLFIMAGEKLLSFVPWIIGIILIRCGNLVIGAYKYRTFIVLHTWANKITGILIFVTALVFIVTENVMTLYPVSIVAVISAVEEGLIHLTANKLSLNRRGLLLK